MKCPKCGFVSFPGLPQCKRCGHLFPAEPPGGKPSAVPSLFSADSPLTERSLEPPPAPSPPQEPPLILGQGEEPAPSSSNPSHRPGPEAAPSTPVEGAGPAWREELSQRVENFRRRRAHLRGSSDSSSNLEFDFAESSLAEVPEESDIPLVEPLDGPEGIDAELSLPHAHAPEAGAVDSVELQAGGNVAGLQEISDVETEPPELEPRPVPRSVHFVLDSAPPREMPEVATLPAEIYRAPMSRRFLGGMIDALVLLMAAGVFALIFWRAGGHLSLNTFNLAIVAIITTFLALAYFGAFTALTSTTPGLLWVGIEVRSLEGGHPTLHQSFWRAFGYLVSASALFLGFVWALVDSEGLTWHDRMSDTFLASTDSVEGSTADS